MAHHSTGFTRRAFLEGAIVLPALAAAVTGVAAADASKAPQAQMHYQTSPNGNMHCAICKFFIPGKDASSNGTCQIVDGSISPNGYCMAYTPKSS
ncbi:MAG: high-potential iron-sulfur protein [Candidatus Eremiobacteraeota bacterium]|nr:high-potential iron-sulfur protein [Candidatus Eremiobacteraeota bacterium]MBV8498631.1 high-potential iron-sulfur protein [Candidatus Eremiobacteraeota bacterium]